MTINVLDNPVWHALAGPHRMHALGGGLARHYPRDMAPFSAIAEPSAAAYADLAAGLPAGTEARLFRPQIEPLPDGWKEINALDVQMVATRQRRGRRPEVSALFEAEARQCGIGGRTTGTVRFAYALEGAISRPPRRTFGGDGRRSLRVQGMSSSAPLCSPRPREGLRRGR